MPQFTAVSDVPLPPEALFAHIVDVSAWPLFTGYGPLPGIRAASLPAGEVMRLGARVRVDDADGTHHFEQVEAFEHGKRLTLRMELTPPASMIMASILEEMTLEPVAEGTRLSRTFTATPRSWLTLPFAWFFGHFLLRRAVRRHNENVAEHLAAG